MTYALKRASSVLVRKENWASFEAHVCHVAMGYPNTLQTVARILSTYAKVGYPLGRDRLSRLINAVVQDHAPLGHHSEVAWCLWMCKDIDLKLIEANVDLVAEMHSSVCALLLLDLAVIGKLPKQPKTTYWKEYAESTEALRGDLWLLSYEAGLRGWAGLTDAHIQADPHFAQLRLANVHFYDQTAALTPIFHVKPDALQKHNLADVSDLFDLDDVDQLIEYEEGDGGYEGVVLPGEDEVKEDEDEYLA